MPTNAAMLLVTAGQEHCQVTLDNCVTDGGYDYGNSEACTIEVVANGTLTATEFDVEEQLNASSGCPYEWDVMVIDGTRYCGLVGPVNAPVSGGTSFTWQSDDSLSSSGWVVCWSAAGTTCHGVSDHPLCELLYVQSSDDFCDNQ